MRPRNSSTAQSSPTAQTSPAAAPTSTEYDVVVVGARVAGAATAMLLARCGHRVLMLDRSQPSRDTNSTHSLVRGGVVQLARWGLLDDVVATGTPQIRSVSFHRGGEVARHRIKDRAGVDFLIAPRRYVLDDLLARAAVSAGAQLLTGATLANVLRDADGRVTGVTIRDSDGAARAVGARLVVGADGVHSSTAAHVNAAIAEEHERTGASFYTYVADVPWDGFEFHLGEGSYAGVFPTHGGQACVWLSTPEEDASSIVTAGADRVAAWLEVLDRAAPDLAHRVRGGTITAPLRGAIALPNQVRRATGPGWALVGDAGYHRDPITGHGITDAFRDAELLAEAADATLRLGEIEEVAMAGYERRRDAAIAETFAITRALGAFPPAAEFEALQARFSRALDAEAGELASRPVVGRIADRVTSAA